MGKLNAALNKNKSDIQSLEEVEFQVFSQRGEDGIIQFILSKIEIPNKIFIEFGVENYTESNTRFLLINNWSGLVIDGSKLNIRFIKSDFIYWKYDITAVHSFITNENINKILGSYTKVKDIGLLSIDLDGNDYWIWEAITVINPRIVICEYNSVFGDDKKVSIPYVENFIRRKAHYSDLYFGASLSALVFLADMKGYDFIGTGSAGVNAFFVRKELSSPFKNLDAISGYRKSPNRDSRDNKGNLTFATHDERLNLIKDKSIYDFEQRKEILIKDLYDGLTDN